MKRLLLFLFAVAVLSAQDATKVGRPWQVGMSALPSSAAKIWNQSASIDYMYFANTSASAVTITVTDGSTNCNGAACQIVPTISIAGSTVYSMNCQGVYSANGIYWNASTANVVHGWMAGRF